MAAKGGDSPHGIYLEKCKNVQYGFFGNLEVISKTGAKVLTKYMDECKVEAFDVTIDSACEADRPLPEKKNKKWHSPDCSTLTSVAAHPFENPQEHMRCLGQMTGR